jgi:hypothetical protein
MVSLKNQSPSFDFPEKKNETITPHQLMHFSGEIEAEIEDTMEYEDEGEPEKDWTTFFQHFPSITKFNVASSIEFWPCAPAPYIPPLLKTGIASKLTELTIKGNLSQPSDLVFFSNLKRLRLAVDEILDETLSFLPTTLESLAFTLIGTSTTLNAQLSSFASKCKRLTELDLDVPSIDHSLLLFKNLKSLQLNLEAFKIDVLEQLQFFNPNLAVFALSTKVALAPEKILRIVTWTTLVDVTLSTPSPIILSPILQNNPRLEKLLIKNSKIIILDSQFRYLFVRAIRLYL